MTGWDVDYVVVRISGPLRVLLSVVLVLCLATGCTRTASRSLDIGPSEVDRIEVYVYTWDAPPREVRRSVITDRVELAGYVRYWNNLPVRKVTAEGRASIPGSTAVGLRFHLRDGRAIEATQMFLKPSQPGGPAGGSVQWWPDGTLTESTLGADMSLDGTPADPAANTLVPVGEQPKAPL